MFAILLLRFGPACWVKIKLIEALGIEIDGEMEKGVFEFSLTELLEKLSAPTSYEEHPVGEEKQYKPFSQYPYVSRDISLWVEEGVSAEDVEKVLTESAGDLLVRITLFDEFTKDGRTSYAFRLVFQSYEKTLTDDEITPIMDSISGVIDAKGWDIR